MPVWQRVYEEINDPDFVLICVAEDTGGEAVAGPIFDAAAATYVQVVDPDHRVSSAFNFINVPSAAWIDENGHIVRIDEGTYAQIHQFGEGDAAISFGTDVYTPALKDWVAKGAASRHIQNEAQIAANARSTTTDHLRAEAAFRLGNLFRQHGEAEKAEHYWRIARELHPESVNYFRQDLTLTEEGSAGARFMAFRDTFVTEGRDYYRPMNLD